MDANQQIGTVVPDTFKAIQPKMLAVGLEKEQIAKEISFAVQQINSNKMLQSCDALSTMMAVTNCANIGLTLNPASKEAYLVPRKGKAILDPSYIGLVKLITAAGIVKSIYANVVYEVDDFAISLVDTGHPIRHNPSLRPGRTKSKVIGYYALAVYQDGQQHPEWMDIEQIHEIRDKYSESWKAYSEGKLDARFCTWASSPDEMGRKTVIKRLYKYLPRSGAAGEKLARIDRAIEIDNQDFGITMGQSHEIENLLMAATLPFEETQMIYQAMTSYSYQEARDVIRRLRDHQPESLARQSHVDAAISEAVARDDYYEREE
jgi:recombination protein RecT